jgi:vacuolar protein sorting-associated protein 13A/C
MIFSQIISAFSSVTAFVNFSVSYYTSFQKWLFIQIMNTNNLRLSCKPQGNADLPNEDGENGLIKLAAHFFTVYGEGDYDEESEETESQLSNGSQKFGAIEVSVTRNGPWSPVRLNYGLGPAPWHLGRDHLASEMVVHEGVKHLFVRTLVTLTNETEYVLEARLCPDFLVGQETEKDGLDVNNLENSVEEEIFENQRIQSGKGWGHPTLPTDPGHWCRRDLSGSSKVDIFLRP